VVGKAVVFTAEITNPGQQSLANVVVSVQTDAPLAVAQVTEGASPRGNEWIWSLPSIPPGRPIRIQVQCDCKQPAAKACCRFAATPTNGLSVEGQACLEITATPPTNPTAPTAPTVIPGRLRVRVDNLNKVTAGKNQQFLVQVTNEGDYAENDVIVTARIPAGSVAGLGTIGPNAGIKFTTEAGLVRFSPVADLAPKATIDYRIEVTTTRPGPISLQAEARSRRQTQPAAGETTVEVLPAE
jgi:hypothetical protein